LCSRDWDVDFVTSEKAFGQLVRDGQGGVVEGQGISVEILAVFRAGREQRPDGPVGIAEIGAMK
jgi:hypothetical protein